jgi:GNAT superfamily N-acetyltransferase
MVHPAWQSKRVGSAMMQKLTQWLDKNAPDNAFIVLITPENLKAFYQQFGFTPAFSMIRRIQRSEN